MIDAAEDVVVVVAAVAVPRPDVVGLNVEQRLAVGRPVGLRRTRRRARADHGRADGLRRRRQRHARHRVVHEEGVARAGRNAVGRDVLLHVRRDGLEARLELPVRVVPVERVLRHRVHQRVHDVGVFVVRVGVVEVHDHALAVLRQRVAAEAGRVRQVGAGDAGDLLFRDRAAERLRPDVSADAAAP